MGACLQALHLGERHLDEALRAARVAGEGDADVALQLPARGRRLRAEEGRHAHGVHLPGSDALTLNIAYIKCNQA